MEEKGPTWGTLMHLFRVQFPGLDIDDYRPNGPVYQMYVWLRGSSVNLIATYRPETVTFVVETTREPWTLLNQ